jgi:hypothetical protein
MQMDSVYYENSEFCYIYFKNKEHVIEEIKQDLQLESPKQISPKNIIVEETKNDNVDFYEEFIKQESLKDKRRKNIERKNKKNYF